jgi:spore germination protein GerM
VKWTLTFLPATALLSAFAGCREPAPDTEPDVMQVAVFFTQDEKPYRVERQTPRRPDVLTATLEQLLQGPTDDERAAGIASWFSDATAGMLAGVDIDEDGHAVVDFNDFRPIISGASSAAGSAMLLGELNATVGRFEHISSVEYQLEGSCHRFWQFLQRPCEVLPARP